ncbi:MAG: polysaccharide biosynthesis protein [Bacteroidaceae bacterium]
MLYEFLERTHIDKKVYFYLLFVADLFCTFFASICAVGFVSIITNISYSTDYILLFLGSSVLFSAISYGGLRTCSFAVRHSTFHEIGILMGAVLLKEILMGGTLAIMHLHQGFSFPHLVALLLIDVLICMVLLLMERIGVVVSYDVMRQTTQRKRLCPDIFVYGTEEHSVSFVQLQALSPRYNVIGFLIPGTVRRKYRIADKMVYGFENESEFLRLMDRYQVEAVVFTRLQDINEEDARLMKFCAKANVKVLFAPPVEEVGEQEHKPRMAVPREISIEDLLGRPEIEINMEAITTQLADRVVLVTGAAGSIGSELCRQLANIGVSKLVLLDNAETPLHNLRLELADSFPLLNFVPVIGDVRYEHKLDTLFRTYRPQVVFHAAAYKHVPLMEENPVEAVIANVNGSRNVADKCLEYGVEKMVMISTDKAVNPTNIMGCTKRLAEIYVQSLARDVEEGRREGRTQFVTTRFGNVLGSNGSVIPRFREQIAKGGPVTVTHPDITRFFMTIPEACRLVMEAATMGLVNKIFIFDMGRSVRIAHLAERMIELAGYEPGTDIKIEYTGLRPGEKLYEEVLSNEENTIPTGHEKIRVAKVREYEYNRVAERLERLSRLAMEGNVPDMIRLMKHLVPEFKSQNSEYEKYDAEIEEEIIRLQH